ncbi:MAG: hypothetical protein ABSF82_08240 [Candidatus Bathyarchaeia archaeon]
MDSVGLVVELVGILFSIGVVCVTLWFAKLFRGGAFEMPLRCAAIGFIIFTLAQLTQFLSQLQVLGIPAVAYDIFMTCFTGAVFTSVLIAAYSWKNFGKH